MQELNSSEKNVKKMLKKRNKDQICTTLKRQNCTKKDRNRKENVFSSFEMILSYM